jgi:uncharacterized membrane protein YphA (DoxX/SURF4 family)
MRIAALIARILMGLTFLVFGLNGFLHFIPQGPPPTGAAGEFTDAIITSHFFMMVAAVQIVGGVLLLVPSGLSQAIVVAILWTIVAIREKQYLSGIFVQRTA